jgi:hypothetical protein
MKVHQELQRRCQTAFDPQGPFGLEVMKGLRRVMDQPGSDSGNGAYGPASRQRAAPNTPELEDEQREEDEDEDENGEHSVAGMVRTTMRKRPGLSREKATVQVLDTPLGKRAYERERAVRLRKCLGR